MDASIEEGVTITNDLQFDDDDQDGFIDVNVNGDENPGDDAVDLLHLPQEELQPPNQNPIEQSGDLESSDQQLIGEALLVEQQQNDTIPEPTAQQHDAYEEDENQFEMKPLLLPEEKDDPDNLSTPLTTTHEEIPVQPHIRSRKKPGSGSLNTAEYEDDLDDTYTRRSCLRKNIPTNKEEAYPETNDESSVSAGPAAAMGCGRIRRFCHATSQHYLVRTTVSVMNLLARILLWSSFLAMVVAVVWYSRELKMNGTDPHLIAWFSAGAFVLLGFPISMCGIFMHLTNYYQPNVQCYVVRILWMVPIYSIESWLW